jgi:hypothetical protein
MHIAARARLVLARRPWIHWSAVAIVAAVAALSVHAHLAALDRSRLEWGASRPVLVARHAAEPGEAVAADAVAVPTAMIPDGALEEWPPGARLTRRVGRGEILTELDLTTADGPAALADPGTAVVAVPDPLAAVATVGSPVLVAADGIVLTERATVVASHDGTVFVAVDRRDAATVAAAVNQRIASLLFLP